MKVPHGKIEVIGEDNHEIVADVICANDKDATDCDLFFSAKLKASSFSYFKINPSINSLQVQGKKIKELQAQNLGLRINKRENIKVLTATSRVNFAFPE